MKRIGIIASIVLICFLGGYGIGTVVNAIMKGIDNVKEAGRGYIGAPHLNLEDKNMTPEILHTLGYLSDAQVSPDGTKIIYGISYSSIELNKSCRNLWICNLDGSNARELTHYGKSVNNARWSKDGKNIYFLLDGKIWKAAVKGSKIGKRQIISEVPSGISEFCFTPAEDAVLYISTIPGPVKTPDRINPDLDKANAYVADDLMYRHWDHWVTETPRTYYCPIVAGKVLAENAVDLLGDEPYELPTEPFGGLEQLSISPDGKHIAYSCRKLTGKEYAFSTNTDIFIYNIEDGSTFNVTNGGGYDTDPVWSPDGRTLAWVSMERDGYEADLQRLIVADFNHGIISGKRRIASKLDADCGSLTWDEDSQTIYFNATELGIQGIYRVDVDTDKVERITPDNWWYNFGGVYHILKSGAKTTLFTSMQSLLFPTELAAVTVESGSQTTYTRLTKTNDAALSQLGKITVKRISLKTAHNETLYSWVLYPDQFDPEQTYPVIEMFNGGPQSCLDQSWSKRWNFRLMAEQGYVVLLPNRHGCSGFGQAWKEQISGDYQGLNMQDYLQAASWAKSQKWCGKIAAVGASYGGFSVYNMAGIHNGMYDCFISHAGIFDLNAMWYTTEESWFTNWDNGGLGQGKEWGGIVQGGAPYSNLPKTVRQFAQSPDKKVTKWNTPILCIHGMLDFRIPYEQGMAAFNAAQMMGVPSKLIVFPEENHWIAKPQNAIFWQREYFDWLEKWCK